MGNIENYNINSSKIKHAENIFFYKLVHLNKICSSTKYLLCKIRGLWVFCLKIKTLATLFPNEMYH